jgi:hypothetical protein
VLRSGDDPLSSGREPDILTSVDERSMCLMTVPTRLRSAENAAS